MCPGGETGRRKGLKIPRPLGYESSILSPGTTVRVAELVDALALGASVVIRRGSTPLSHTN